MEVGNKTLIAIFACKTDEDLARVIGAIGLPMAGLALEGIMCTFAKGDNIDDDEEQ